MTALKLRMLRINAGLTRQALADAVEVSAPTIRELEEGKLPREDTAFKVASYFGMKPTDLWPDLVKDRGDRVA